MLKREDVVAARQKYYRRATKNFTGQWSKPEIGHTPDHFIKNPLASQKHDSLDVLIHKTGKVKTINIPI